MKIAQCLEYPLGLRGGVSVVVENLASKLREQGHQIVLVSPDTEETLPSGNSDRLFEGHIHWNPKSDFATSAKSLAQKLKAQGVDIAHFHAGGNYGWGIRVPFRSPAFYVDRLNIPVFWTSHRAESILDGFCGPQKPLLFKLLLFPVAWLGKIQQLYCCRFEIAVSRDNLRKLQRWYYPLRSRFVQIYHSRLQNRSPLPQNTEREPIILYVGHFAPIKGQTILVKAFARLAERHPAFNLMLAGDHGEAITLQEVQTLIKDHRLEKRVFLLGERSDTVELMKRAAIYVQPSLNEALGLALQEAMFCGCAVIGSRVGGIPELIDKDDVGTLVPPGDVDRLYEALDHLISHPKIVRESGAAAAMSIRERHMTADGMALQYLRLYETALKKN